MALTFQLEGQKPLTLNQPAFLVGNGINYADGCELSWASLLIKMLPKELKKNLLGSSSNKTLSKQEKEKLLEEKLKKLTYPEIAELALAESLPEEFDKKSKQDFMSKVAEEVENNIEKASKSNKRHKNLVKFAHDHGIPILTTNFDRNFLRTTYFNKNWESIKLSWIKQKYNNRDYQTLKNACFCPKSLNNIGDIHLEFAVWHIHGVVTQPQSICFTNWDYGNYYSAIKTVSKERRKPEYEGNSTWIDILLDNDLIIMGLGLDSFETDLRALLVERLIKQKIYEKIAKESGETSPKRAQTIYIYRKEGADKEMPPEKEALFKALDIVPVEMAEKDIFELNYLR